MKLWPCRKAASKEPPTHDEAVHLLEELKRSQEKIANYDSNPNAGYNTPDKTRGPYGPP